MLSHWQMEEEEGSDSANQDHCQVTFFALLRNSLYTLSFHQVTWNLR